jgi:glycerol uptake facilitator-like aquaporin
VLVISHFLKQAPFSLYTMSTSPLLLPREPNPLSDGANGATAKSNSRQPNILRVSRATPDYRSISIMLWPDPTSSSSSDSRYRARHGTLAAITCRMRISTRLRHHMVAGLGELFGTASFLFFAFLATNIVNTAMAQTPDQPLSANADPARLLFICLAFGTSLAVNVAAFASISGAMFNPAITLGLLVVRQIDFVRAVLVVPAQLLGGIVAAALVKALTPAPLTVGTELSTETKVVQGLFIEMFLTAMLVFVIFMVTVEQPGAANAPIVIGLALFMAELGYVLSLDPA